MKLRLFHRNTPRPAPLGTARSLHPDTLSMLSVGLISMTPEGIVTHINARAREDLCIEDKTPSSPRHISDLLSVCHDKQNLLPGVFDQLRPYGSSADLPAWSYVRLRDRNLKFYAEGRFEGRYDRKRKLKQIDFLFRNIEEEITRKFILDMAMSQTKIFPWFFDLDNNRMIIDARWYSHLDIPTEDCTISSEEFFALVHPDDRATLSEALSKQLKGELIPDSFTYRLRRGDGTWEWFEEQSIYLGRTDDAPYRIVGICQSIHPFKTTEQHLRAARDKAQESDRLKSAFLANMSHEIRTPLNAIIGFANLLTSEQIPSSDEEKQEYSRLITANGEQLLRLISDILDLSKIESNTMEFHFEEQSLDLLLTDVYQTQKLNMPPKGVDLLLELPLKDATIRTDASRLKQVINNLIDNAVKFTEQGSITFGYRFPDDADQVELFVRDTGKGISQEHLEHIFERFYKADTFVKGAGLGLSICRTIAQTLGGTISVASEPGKGTCFTVRHPLQKASETPGI